MAVHESLEPFVLAVVLAHRARVDAQRQPGVGVAELRHHLGRAVAQRKQERGVRSP